MPKNKIYKYLIIGFITFCIAAIGTTIIIKVNDINKKHEITQTITTKQ